MGTWAKAADNSKTEIAMSKNLIDGPETRVKKTVQITRKML